MTVIALYGASGSTGCSAAAITLSSVLPDCVALDFSDGLTGLWWASGLHRTETQWPEFDRSAFTYSNVTEFLENRPTGSAILSSGRPPDRSLWSQFIESVPANKFVVVDCGTRLLPESDHHLLVVDACVKSVAAAQLTLSTHVLCGSGRGGLPSRLVSSALVNRAVYFNEWLSVNRVSLNSGDGLVRPQSTMNALSKYLHNIGVTDV